MSSRFQGDIRYTSSLTEILTWSQASQSFSSQLNRIELNKVSSEPRSDLLQGSIEDVGSSFQRTVDSYDGLGRDVVSSWGGERLSVQGTTDVKGLDDGGLQDDERLLGGELGVRRRRRSRSRRPDDGLCCGRRRCCG